jgi:hypothetical protein
MHYLLAGKEFRSSFAVNNRSRFARNLKLHRVSPSSLDFKTMVHSIRLFSLDNPPLCNAIIPGMNKNILQL